MKIGDIVCIKDPEQLVAYDGEKSEPMYWNDRGTWAQQSHPYKVLAIDVKLPSKNTKDPMSNNTIIKSLITNTIVFIHSSDLYVIDERLTCPTCRR